MNTYAQNYFLQEREIRITLKIDVLNIALALAKIDGEAFEIEWYTRRLNDLALCQQDVTKDLGDVEGDDMPFPTKLKEPTYHPVPFSNKDRFFEERAGDANTDQYMVHVYDGFAFPPTVTEDSKANYSPIKTA